eukprot:3544306-Lingulodinium_polyedra.AAC.1
MGSGSGTGNGSKLRTRSTSSSPSMHWPPRGDSPSSWPASASFAAERAEAPRPPPWALRPRPCLPSAGAACPPPPPRAASGHSS